MTKKEINRTLVRTFTEATRNMQGIPATPAIVEDAYRWAVATAHDTSQTRRSRVRARYYAHALATAWGL